MDRGAADRILLGYVRPPASEGRRTSHGLWPKLLPGPTEPASCKDGPVIHLGGIDGKEFRFVGIDVSKAQVDVAVRPAIQRWVVSYDETEVGILVS